MNHWDEECLICATHGGKCIQCENEQLRQRVAELERQREALFSKLDKMEGRATLAEVQRYELVATLYKCTKAVTREHVELIVNEALASIKEKA